MISDFINQRWKRLLQQLLCCIMPTVMGVILSSPSAKRWILDNSPDYIKEILLLGWVQILVIIAGTVVIPCIVFYCIELFDYDKKNTGYNILLNLITNIDSVVNEKRLRFKKTKDDNKLKSDTAIFRNITQPEKQIKELCKGLCLMMRFMTQENNVKATIFYCSEDEIKSLMAVCGEDSIKAKIEDLNKNSLAKNAMKEGTSILVEDTDKNNDFLKPKGCRAKSIFICPVFNGKDILFIICFSSNNKAIFKKEDIGKYEMIVKEFGDRIMLEWHLLELKNINK